MESRKTGAVCVWNDFAPFLVKFVCRADLFLLFFLLVSSAPEAPVEDTVTSPVKNLQKKTDLFQLQKVLYHFNKEVQLRHCVTVLSPGVSRRPYWK